MWEGWSDLSSSAFLPRLRISSSHESNAFLDCQSGLQDWSSAPDSCLALEFSSGNWALPLNSPLPWDLFSLLGPCCPPWGPLSPAYLPQPAAVPMKAITWGLASHLHLGGYAHPAVILQIHPDLTLSCWIQQPTHHIYQDNEDRVTNKGQVIAGRCSNFSSLLELFIPIHSGIARRVQVGILEGSKATGEHIPMCSSVLSTAPFLHFAPNSPVLEEGESAPLIEHNSVSIWCKKALGTKYKFCFCSHLQPFFCRRICSYLEKKYRWLLCGCLEYF